MSEFEIGDRVRVRKDLKSGEIYEGTYFAPRMEKYLGKVFTIEGFDNDGDIIHDQWWFSPEMLEHVDDKQVEHSSQSEQVDHPSHYNHGGMETIDKMRIMFGDEAVKTFCRLNAFKYIDRADYKENKEQDLAKAEWYLNYAKNMEEENDG